MIYFLAFLLPLALCDRLFSEPTVMSQFVMEDTLTLSPFRADLVLEIDLYSVQEDVRATCRLINFLETKEVHLPSLVKQMDVICSSHLSTWRSIMDFLTGTHKPSSTRLNRSGLTSLLSSLFHGVVGFVFGDSHSPNLSDDALFRNQEHFVSALRQMDHRGQLDHRHVIQLAKALGSSDKNHSLREDNLEAALSILSATFGHSLHLSHVVAGLSTVIQFHTLSPELISPFVLERKMEHLASQVSVQGKRLAISSELDVFKCPVSFSTSLEYIFRVVVHVPVSDAKDIFSVYRYLPCLLYTSPSPRDKRQSRMPSSA